MTAKKKPAPMGPEPAPVVPVAVDHSPLDGWFELAPRTMTRYVKAIIGAASTDNSRPILTGVYVDANTDRLIMVATDSYRLYRITHPWTGVTLKACRGIVPASWLSRVVRQSFANKAPKMRFAFENRRVDATYVSGDGRRESMSTELIDGKVPDGLNPSTVGGPTYYVSFESIFSSALSADKVVYPAAFNPEYLGAALRAAKLFRGSGGNAPVRLHGIDPLKASLFTVIADDGTNAVFDILLMPVRVPT